jgi:hypothetical protein
VGLAEPIWTMDGEILNIDRMAHYRGPRIDEGVKLTSRERDPVMFQKLTDFLGEARYLVPPAPTTLNPTPVAKALADNRADQVAGVLSHDEQPDPAGRAAGSSSATATGPRRPSGPRSLPTWQPDYYQPGVQKPGAVQAFAARWCQTLHFHRTARAYAGESSLWA